jgi:uncharacterized membrane protein
MTLLVLAAAWFVAIHLLSLVGLRQRLVAAIGEERYRGLFALGSLAGLVGMGIGYSLAGKQPDLVSLGAWALIQTTPMTLIAFELIVLAFMFPNPGAVGGDQQLAKANEPAAPIGIQHVTRHPFLWGMALWSGSHVLANPDLRSILLFGALFLVGLVGTVAIDRKRRAALGERWAAYARLTSNLPFAAILARRTSLGLREFGWRPLLPLLFFAAFYLAHGPLFGAPLPPH